MKTSNKAYWISGSLGALAGVAVAMATSSSGTNLTLFAITGCLVAHSTIWAIYSVAAKLADD